LVLLSVFEIPAFLLLFNFTGFKLLLRLVDLLVFTVGFIEEILLVVVVVDLRQSLALVNRWQHYFKLLIMLVFVSLVQFAVKSFVDLLARFYNLGAWNGGVVVLFAVLR
jgi:hypothetical protein